MKTKITIGESPEESEIRVKKYASGMEVVESGDAIVDVVGKKPVLTKTTRLDKKEKEELLAKPDKFKISKGKLVRKGKNK